MRNPFNNFPEPRRIEPGARWNCYACKDMGEIVVGVGAKRKVVTCSACCDHRDLDDHQCLDCGQELDHGARIAAAMDYVDFHQGYAT